MVCWYFSVYKCIYFSVNSFSERYKISCIPWVRMWIWLSLYVQVLIEMKRAMSFQRIRIIIMHIAYDGQKQWNVNAISYNFFNSWPLYFLRNIGLNVHPKAKVTKKIVHLESESNLRRKNLQMHFWVYFLQVYNYLKKKSV